MQQNWQYMKRVQFPLPFFLSPLTQDQIMSIFFLHAFAFVLLTTLVSSQLPATKHIFILAGQSNMAGRGGVHHGVWDGHVPPECRSDPSVLRLNARLRWEQAREPLHADIDVNKTCGVGPGMAFANALRAGAQVGLVGLVPCAVGGTKIAEWGRGTALYMNMVERAKASVKEGGVIKALLWYQGERDTVHESDADSYKSNMERLVRDLRFDLKIPTLPVIQVALASGEGPYIGKVREAQKGINLPSITWVDALGLPLNQDNIHLTTQAQLQLGKKLADDYLMTESNQETQQPDPDESRQQPDPDESRPTKSLTQSHQPCNWLCFVLFFSSIFYLIL